MNDSALYIHIPFCDHKCIYCDFYSIITSDNISRFLIALKKEIDYYSFLRSSDRKFTSIFLGGGTPSLMSPAYLDEIITYIKNSFPVDDRAEITMETNPGTVDKTKLAKFRETGINRVSIGIQSFDDAELKFLTRIHNGESAIRTVYDAADAGFENISIDLIFNLPAQTESKWIKNLETAAGLPIQHISAYSLILEKGTILNKLVLDGKIILQDEDHDAELYETATDFLISNGFYQYEVSNFTKPGFECVHNNAYWRYRDYLGLGTSAHSFIKAKRWWNFSSLKKYINQIDSCGNAVMNSENLSLAQMHDEYIMLALRSSGLDLVDYKSRFGNEWIEKKYDYFESLKNENFVFMGDNEIRLTARGYAVCDEILKNIL